jgi:enterochelin esterase-like enzyme
MRLAIFFLLTLSSFATAKLTISWEEDILTVHAPHLPGQEIKIWYLEAYCRPGSTDREWNETVIGHETKLLSATPTRIQLRCTLSDGVIVDHLITAQDEKISFALIAHNPTPNPSLAHWAQPCIRVGEFTGTQTDDDKYTYLKNSFIFLDNQQSFLPTPNWATEARYIPGQVWCPCHVPRSDVNPRPLSSDLPSNGLIGCISSDQKWLLATAWEPYQELFQGVIRCLHSDFRIGGLEPGEKKSIQGALYLMPNDPADLLRRYQSDFPKQALQHRTLALPTVTHEKPGPGKRVLITPSSYQGTQVHHSLYLPPHWNPDWKSSKERYPLIVEFSGNHAPTLGSTGRVEDSALGYGLTAGRAVWLNLPFISPDKQDNQLTWWGDEQAAIDYALAVVPQIIADYGINPHQVILCGFSRGAIAVNYIGLHDDEIASLWSAFVTHDHYDGVNQWSAPWGAPLEKYRREAAQRRARIKGRPVLICQNGHTREIQKLVGEAPNFSYLDINTTAILGTFPNPTTIHPHTDRWLLKPSTSRNQAWAWMEKQGLFSTKQSD